MCDSETMFIGRVDDIQKLHIRTVPLGESPARVAHLKENGSIAVLTCRQKVGRGGIDDCVPKCLWIVENVAYE